jgi:hypothetical protein
MTRPVQATRQSESGSDGVGLEQQVVECIQGPWLVLSDTELHDEGPANAARLEAAGVPVQLRIVYACAACLRARPEFRCAHPASPSKARAWLG